MKKARLEAFRDGMYSYSLCKCIYFRGALCSCRFDVDIS